MRTLQEVKIIKNQDTHDHSQNQWTTQIDVTVSHRSYHELADQAVIELDALTQLEKNVDLLEDLQGRLSFMMREVQEGLKL
jgi:hypothetical protein